MDFLRRLHPGHAAGKGAARLDLAPRWTEPLQAPLETDSALPVEATRPRVTAAGRDRTDSRTQDAASGPEGDPVPVAAALPAAPTFARSPAAEALLRVPAERSPPMAAAPPATAPRASGVAPRGVVAPIDASVAPRARASDTEPSARPVPFAIGPGPARAAQHQQPLRAEALAERASPTAGAPPIVHVTIDRIDIRLPAADAAPSARERRPRAAGAVAPLSDYLRGPQRGGHG